LREFSHAELREFSHAELSKFAMAHVQSPRARATGGVVLELPDLRSVENWLDFWGVSVSSGSDQENTVTLFKAVDENFKSEKGMSYAPGETPSAPDFSTANACGGGLHLCAHPRASLNYFRSATKFVACEVNVADIVVITDSDGRSDKVKVAKVLKCVEVDADGKSQ
jgi:hypothetical protein